jgi:hypothetical protein
MKSRSDRQQCQRDPPNMHVRSSHDARSTVADLVRCNCCSDFLTGTVEPDLVTGPLVLGLATATAWSIWLSLDGIGCRTTRAIGCVDG